MLRFGQPVGAEGDLVERERLPGEPSAPHRRRGQDRRSATCRSFLSPLSPRCLTAGIRPGRICPPGVAMRRRWNRRNGRKNHPTAKVPASAELLWCRPHQNLGQANAQESGRDRSNRASIPPLVISMPADRPVSDPAGGYMPARSTHPQSARLSGATATAFEMPPGEAGLLLGPARRRLRTTRSRRTSRRRRSVLREHQPRSSAKRWLTLPISCGSTPSLPSASTWRLHVGARPLVGDPAAGIDADDRRPAHPAGVPGPGRDHCGGGRVSPPSAR